MTNYYTKARTTAKDFFNEVCEAHINGAKEVNEKIVHILIWNLSVSAWELLEIAKEHGYNARLYKSRTLVINL